MRFYIGVTDNSWYRRLAALRPDEVNFWKPGGGTFKVLEPGGLFLFKLHSPDDYIAGGGFFIRHEILPLSLAWDAFERKNGADSQHELWRMIDAKRKDGQLNPSIGCTILNEPFFFERKDWIRAPRDWAKSIVQGKGYQTEEAIGREIWDQVMDRLAVYRAEQIGAAAEARGLAPAGAGRAGEEAAMAASGYGAEYLTRARLGQGAFRVLVTGAYHRRCAITGERTLPVLEAAHIQPFAAEGPNRTDNGLLLRSDLHILFDRGYLTVTPDHHVEVSRRIKDEFDNGREYYPLHGRELVSLPEAGHERPSRLYLAWHNEEVYAG